MIAESIPTCRRCGRVGVHSESECIANLQAALANARTKAVGECVRKCRSIAKHYSENVLNNPSSTEAGRTVYRQKGAEECARSLRSLIPAPETAKRCVWTFKHPNAWITSCKSMTEGQGTRPSGECEFCGLPIEVKE